MSERDIIAALVLVCGAAGVLRDIRRHGRESSDGMPRRRTRRHRGTAPFGMTQRQFTAAQRHAMHWQTPIDEYDATPHTTGWIEETD